jgi:hypothetical protein
MPAVVDLFRSFLVSAGALRACLMAHEMLGLFKWHGGSSFSRLRSVVISGCGVGVWIQCFQ